MTRVQRREQITQSVMGQLGHGSIILLHDGGGNRANTVKALPMIIEGLHARGYQIVSVHELLGKSYADVMAPDLDQRAHSGRWWIRLAS